MLQRSQIYLIYYIGLVVVGFWWLISFNSLRNEATAKTSAPERSAMVDMVDMVNIVDQGHQVLENMFNGVIKGRNPLCQTLRRHRMANPSGSMLRYVLTLSCRDAFQQAVAGTGNLIHAILYIHLTAKTFAPITVDIQCIDGENEKDSLILPWLMGSATYTEDSYSQSEVICRKTASEIPIHELLPELRRKLARMVLSTTGHFPTELHLSTSGVISDRTSISQNMSRIQMELDDVVIHFRCGDILVNPHPWYGWDRFGEIVKVIGAQSPLSVGIVTQPFDPKSPNVRPADQYSSGQRCRTLVESLVIYLQRRYPATRIRVRNNASEPLTAIYSRIILANQTISGVSSFSVLAAVSGKGRVCVRRPFKENSSLEWVIARETQSATPNLIVFEPRDFLRSIDLVSVWERNSEGPDAVLEWFNGKKRVE